MNCISSGKNSTNTKGSLAAQILSWMRENHRTVNFWKQRPIVCLAKLFPDEKYPFFFTKEIFTDWPSSLKATWLLDPHKKSSRRSIFQKVWRETLPVTKSLSRTCRLYIECPNYLGLWIGTHQNNIPIIMLTEVNTNCDTYYQFSNMQIGTLKLM